LQKADGSILGTFTPKYKYKPWGTTLSAELKTSRDFKAEAVVDEQLLPGLKATVTGESKGEDLFSTFAVEYKHELATVTASVDYGQAAGSTLKATTVVGSQGFSVGGSAEYFFGATTDSLLKELHTVLGYSTDEFDIAAFGYASIFFQKSLLFLPLIYFTLANCKTRRMPTSLEPPIITRSTLICPLELKCHSTLPTLRPSQNSFLEPNTDWKPTQF
jgi:hypothetical protein